MLTGQIDWPLPFSSAYHSPAPAILQRLPFSSACHSPATASLQHLPFSSDYHSPAPAILQRLPVSSTCHSPATTILSAYHSPATTILQRLPFSSAYYSPAPTILQCLPFSSAYHLQLLCFQPLSFSSHFLSCLFTTLFQAVSDGSYYREETRFHYLRRCEGGGQRAYQYLAERRMD